MRGVRSKDFLIEKSSELCARWDSEVHPAFYLVVLCGATCFKAEFILARRFRALIPRGFVLDERWSREFG